MNRKFFGIAGALAVLLMSGLILAGCDNETNSNTTPKVLSITGLTGQQQSGSVQVGIFTSGTTPGQAMAQTGIVAGADSNEGAVTVSGSTATFELWAAPNYNSRWTGSGTYDVYLIVGESIYYRGNVDFVSATTQVAATSFSPINQ